MPYPTIASLPDTIRVLPVRGQRVWRAVFNNAVKRFPETRARKMAWGAVKRLYKKQGDKWIERKGTSKDRGD